TLHTRAIVAFYFLLPKQEGYMGANDFQFRFTPSAASSTRVLGPLESDIMDVIWRRGTSTVSQVHKELRAKKEIAYTTVMTTLTRLARKKLLDQDKSSLSYLYSARLDKPSFDRYVVTGVVETLMADYRDIFLECLNSTLGSLTDAERDKIRGAQS
ncbi:MAG: BlaI/MecI/CopY family transcriptional regulator, partial [Chloroflexia bacterium]